MTGLTEISLATLIYISSAKGTVLSPDSTITTRSATGAPYTAQTCEAARMAQVTKAKARKGVRAISVFCIERIEE
jgi:hypothetical protein